MKLLLLLPILAAGLTVVVGAPAAADEKSAGDAVECANLIYAGTKSSVCFSEEFLSTVASETSINTSRKFKAVKLGEKEVFRFPFAVMTGEGAFTLTEDERKNLKLYLEKGGFLLASAGCSSQEWGAALQAGTRKPSSPSANSRKCRWTTRSSGPYLTIPDSTPSSRTPSSMG